MTILKDAWDMIKDRVEWKTTQSLAAKVPQLEERIAALEARLAGASPDLVCDHCASASLTRTGSRPHPTFGMMGKKLAVFRCNACGKESEFNVEHP